MEHESTARQIHQRGYNCSNSVYKAFQDVDHAGGTPPAPRSIAGKCGALLTAQRVLEDLGVARTEELELVIERGGEQGGAIFADRIGERSLHPPEDCRRTRDAELARSLLHEVSDR